MVICRNLYPAETSPSVTALMGIVFWISWSMERVMLAGCRRRTLVPRGRGMESFSFLMTMAPGPALDRSTGREIFWLRNSCIMLRGPRTVTSSSLWNWLEITRFSGRFNTSMGTWIFMSTWSSPTTRYQSNAPRQSETTLSSMSLRFVMPASFCFSDCFFC